MPQSTCCQGQGMPGWSVDRTVSQCRRKQKPTGGRFLPSPLESPAFRPRRMSTAWISSQLLDKLLHRYEEVPGEGMDSRRGTGLVQPHQWGVWVLVEAEDLGPRAHIVNVLRSAGYAKCQDEPG